MTDLSLDTESFGTTPGSAVVGLGAVFFDTNTGEMCDGFYRAINLATCVNAGLRIEPGAVMWWMGQSDEARNAVRFNTVSLIDALTEFNEWVLTGRNRGDVRPWMRGPSFDGSLMQAAYRAVGMEAPWLYWNERCHRTLTARNPSIPEPERAGTYHNALDDAKHQALWLMKIAGAQRARKQA